MLSGINKLCSQCKEKCKQFSQVVVVRCPNFKSTTQQAHDIALEAQGEAYFDR